MAQFAGPKCCQLSDLIKKEIVLENAKVYGKENFPYSEAAYYSSMLWFNQTEGKVYQAGKEIIQPTQVRVILTIVSAVKRREDAKLDSYIGWDRLMFHRNSLFFKRENVF